MADLERRFAIGVEDLRRPLDRRLPSGVDKFLFYIMMVRAQGLPSDACVNGT
jgi:hypothetical protein